MQLVAYGAQDVYLTGNPQITFWKVTYRRHTNFAMESIERFVETEKIEKPELLFGVGLGGLFINLIGMCLFSGHAHSHGGGGHGHSHGGGGGKQCVQCFEVFLAVKGGLGRGQLLRTSTKQLVDDVADTHSH